MLSLDDIIVEWNKDYITATFPHDNREVHLTNHAIDRFIKRRGGDVDREFPHLDLDDRMDAIYAMCMMISRAGMLKEYQRRVKKIKAYVVDNATFVVNKDKRFENRWSVVTYY